MVRPAPEGISQLRLASALWNKCTEIHRDHEQAKAAIWLTNPAVAAAQETLDEADAAVAADYEQIRASRQADRTTIPRGSDLAGLTAAQHARDQARTARDQAREAALPALRQAFADAKAGRAAAVRATYPQWTGYGLGWGTVNDITRPSTGRLDRAVKKLEQDRAAGVPAQLQFRRFDGTGTLTVQVQGGAGVPPRTIPALDRGEHPRSGVLRLEPWADPAAGRLAGHARHGTMTLVIGRERSHGPVRLVIPVILDRHVPADADVCEVKVTRFRTGTRFRVKVSVICQIPAPAAPAAGKRVAVRLDWKAAGDGWVRVAHVASSAPLPAVPRSAERIVKVSGNRRDAEVFFSPHWRRLLDRDHAIRSVRDENLDAVKTRVADALRAHPGLAAALGVTAGEVTRWRSARQMARLAARWPGICDEHTWMTERAAEWKQAHPPGGRAGRWRRQMIAGLRDAWAQGIPLAAPLRDWRSRDRHLLDFEAHETAQVLASRRDAYRNVAAWLCAGTAGLVVDGTDLAAAKRAPGLEREDPYGARGARRLQHGAAPGEFRDCLLAAAQRRGIPVTAVKADTPGTAGRDRRKAA